VRETSDAYVVSIDVRTGEGKRVAAEAKLAKKTTRLRDNRVLKVRFVDVGQGDGAIVETPGGQIVLIDGGEGEEFRRYFFTAFAYRLKGKPVPCAAIVMTHGDSDHYKGLLKLFSDSPLITSERVFHNGIVRVADGSDAKKVFGASKQVGSKWYLTALQNDLTKLPANQKLTEGFREMADVLPNLKAAGKKLKVQRLEYGQDDAFDFLAKENINVRVLGPIVEEVSGKAALPILHKPRSRSYSDSHTINGHSIVLKLTYGNVRFLFGADLNEESEERLVAKAREEGDSLAAEILKVPHHGAEDFSTHIFEAIRPVVSVVSSGDESASKDYIHPRAGLIGALGKYSRAGVERPLIYVSEMVAFFARLSKKDAGELDPFRLYRKTQFGIVHVRTDGERVFVGTHSARDDRKESYVFRVDTQGNVTFEAVSKVSSMKAADETEE
ncbi:MAG TPA: MBL fold metallo-hydrolase, partial [Thermoanaerobaculia bacterium]